MWMFFIGFCLEPHNPPNRWVQSGFPVGYETTYNKPGTSEPFCFCRPFNDVNVANFWRRRFVFWFFGSQKLPEMFCSGPVSHEGMLMFLTQISDLKNLLETFHFNRTPWFSTDPKCETRPTKFTLGNLRCAFAVYLFFRRCEECPGILAQHYVCLRYPSWFQNYICFIILCMFIRGKKTSGFCMTTLKKWITKDFHIGMHASVYPHLVFTCSHVPEKVMMPQSGCGGLNVTATVICNNDPFIRIAFEHPTNRLILSRCPFFS